MARTIGFIGYGHMGSALLEGFMQALPANDWQFCCTARNPDKLAPLASKGVKVAKTAAEVAQNADLVILAVKPTQLPQVLDDIVSHMSAAKTVLSIVAGFSLPRLRQHLGSECAIVRSMPTTTARIGKGIFAFAYDPLNPGPQGLPWLTAIFEKLGLCLNLDEERFPAFSAVAGAGPAYIYAMLQGLEQAAVTQGFPRGEARKFLLQLTAGCAKMAAQNTSSFNDLRDEVCSPAGLSIEGVNVLDRAGLSGILVDAVRAAEQRAREMEN